MSDKRDVNTPRPSIALRDSELPSLTNMPVPPETRRGRRLALSVLLVLAFLCVAWIASPLWIGMVLGTVMAFTTQSLFRKLVHRMGEERRHLAAGIMTVVCGVTGAVLGALALYVLARELFMLVGLLQDKMAKGSIGDFVADRAAPIFKHIGLTRPDVVARVNGQLGALSERAAAAAAVVLQTTTGAVLGLIIALITLYYVLIEWPKIATRLETILPLDPRHTRALVLEFRDVGRSAFVGTVATAIVQGVIGGIGYWMAGVAQPVTWGVATALASFLPLIGTALVWSVIAAYQVFTGNIGSGIFLIAWGVLVVTSLSDYVIRPRLVGKKGHAHPLLMLIALLGGIEVMGLAGLIVAPVVMSLFVAILRIYERETSGQATPFTAPMTLGGSVITTPMPSSAPPASSATPVSGQPASPTTTPTAR